MCKKSLYIFILLIPFIFKSQCVSPYKTKEYFYNVTYIDVDQIQKSIFFTEPLIFQGDLKAFVNGWSINPDIKNAFKLDSISFRFFDGKINGNQTPYEIAYYSNKRKIMFSMTGLIQNSQFVFLHPPREKIFAKLEFSPFPIVRFPLDKNKTWKENISIPEQWTTDSLKWKGNLELEFEYKVIEKDKESYIIEAKSVNSEIKTHAVFYYSESGFSKLIFDNYDKSRIILEIIN